MGTSGIRRLFVGSAHSRNVHSIGSADLIMEKAGEKLIQNLVAFKASQRKDDPERRHGLHGPYEEIVLMKTGRLPDGYYDDPADEIPWGLSTLR